MLLYHLELRKEYRYRPDKAVLAALYVGKHHPPPELLLREVVPQLRQLHANGVPTSAGLRYPRLVWFSGDLQAKVMIMETVSWAGYWGCMWCEIQGEHKGGRMRFNAALGAGQPRTAESVAAQATEASVRGEAVFGVKGLTVMFGIPGYDVVRGNLADIMHLWSNLCERENPARFSEKPKSKSKARHLLPAVDAALAALRPLSTFSRQPQPMSDFQYWKCSEKRNWLLYHAPYILAPLLEDQGAAVAHLLLSATAFWNLTTEDVPEAVVAEAGAMLATFGDMAEDVYGDCHSTLNNHIAALHAARHVVLGGPAWVFASWAMENFAGVLLGKFNGTRGHLHQIARNLALLAQLPKLWGVLLRTTPLVPEPLHRLFDIFHHSSRLHVTDGFHGAGTVQLPGPEWVPVVAFVQEAGASVTGLVSFQRFVRDGHVHTTQEYSAAMRRDNSCCFLQTPGGIAVPVRVVHFARVTVEGGGPLPLDLVVFRHFAVEPLWFHSLDWSALPNCIREWRAAGRLLPQALQASLSRTDAAPLCVAYARDLRDLLLLQHVPPRDDVLLMRIANNVEEL